VERSKLVLLEKQRRSEQARRSTSFNMDGKIDAVTQGRRAEERRQKGEKEETERFGREPESVGQGTRRRSPKQESKDHWEKRDLADRLR